MFENINQNEDKILRLNQKQVSHLVALLLFTGFIIFMVGYYIGKRVVSTASISQPLMANAANSVINAVQNLQAQDDVADLFSDDLEEKIEPIKPYENKVEEDKQIKAEDNRVTKQTSINYCGQLAGFGTLRAAQKYLQDIQKRGFAARLVERKSKSANGVERIWYQVTTPYFSDKTELEDVISNMKKARLCNSAEIVTVKN